MSDLLLELFSEEIPARMQARAASDLQKLVQDELFAAGFMPEGAKAFATPRRLMLVVTGLPPAQPDRREEKKGPRVGAPEQAIAGFLKSAGLESVDQCEVQSDKKGEFYVAVIDEKGRPTADVIAGFMPELLRKFPWPKAMRWGDNELRWVRPLHSILCTFEGEVVPFDLDGIASGDKTAGHRFLASAEIQTRSFDDYEAKLRRAKVVLDGAEREERILEEARGLCAAQGLELVEDVGLLREVAGLAEWPVVMIGSFDEKFLTVPDEALTAAMKGHQKYFSVRNPKTGRLANKFVCVANIEAPDGGAAMRAGYERVLTARLSDAWFLYQQDLKTPLEEHAKKLDKVTFFEGLGTTGDKVRRVAALAHEIAPVVGADPDVAEKAALLAKADLVTDMVYEAPELQGLMGRYYALAQGIEADVADAIRDHYKPAGQNDDVPTAPVSVAVALADKIDTLTAFWAIDQKPTGSKDPFALRRAALGVIQIVLQGSKRFDLKNNLLTGVDFIMTAQYHEVAVGRILKIQEVEKEAFYSEKLRELVDNESSRIKYATLHPDDEDYTPPSGYGEYTNPKKWNELTEDLLAFFHERLKVYLRDKKHRYDHVDAVRFKDDGALEDDLVLIVKKLEALEAFLKTDDGENLLAAYKRASNILKAEKYDSDAKPAAENLPEAEEQALYAALSSATTTVTEALGKEDFASAMSALAGLRAPLDAFFENVKVNADEPDLRANRLALLAAIKATCEQVADLAKIEG
jgi:glycyl-tRNA synthetase beta chain